VEDLGIEFHRMEGLVMREKFLYVPTLYHMTWKGRGKKRKAEHTGVTTAIAAFHSHAIAEMVVESMNDFFYDKGYLDVDLIRVMDEDPGQEDGDV
jgi:hypothetical protein